ncbi:hypothetical protein C8R44DRAFT_885021 [Mycena epipterygia]|nr:hypothetical protein C8R44DRAFT_885021 [Mycena epipterygia]
MCTLLSSSLPLAAPVLSQDPSCIRTLSLPIPRFRSPSSSLLHAASACTLRSPAILAALRRLSCSLHPPCTPPRVLPLFLHAPSIRTCWLTSARRHPVLRMHAGRLKPVLSGTPDSSLPRLLVHVGAAHILRSRGPGR